MKNSIFAVLLRRTVFQIGERRLITLPVLMTNLLSDWSWSKKGRSHQSMNVMRFGFTGEAECKVRVTSRI